MKRAVELWIWIWAALGMALIGVANIWLLIVDDGPYPDGGVLVGRLMIWGFACLAVATPGYVAYKLRSS